MPSYIKVPVVQGRQGGHDFYLGSVSVGMLLLMVRFTDANLPAKERAQRVVSLPAAKGICSYITENPDSYHFNNIELSIMGEAQFEPIPGFQEFGYLTWLDTTAVLINDGQTRSKAFELAVAVNRAIATGEDVKVAFEVKPSLERCRQIASDLNLKQRRFSRALAKYFDGRDPESIIVRLTLESSPTFQNLTDVCNDTISKDSDYLFPYNGFYKATSYLLCGQEDRDLDQQVELATDYWEAIAARMPDWIAVIEGRLTAKQAREGKLHSQAIVLEALGKLGCYLLTRHPKHWEQKLSALTDVDWQRSSPHWQNRVIFGRVIKKDRTALIGIVAYLKQALGLPLDPEEEQIEQAIRSH